MSSQRVLITGAASGIGNACARMLLENGARVLALDLDADAVANSLPTDSDNLAIYAGDLARTATSDGAVAMMLERWDGIDALAHFAAAHSSATWDELEEAEANRVMEVNVTGSFLIAQAAARPMVDAGKGVIVLTTSTSVLHGVTGGEGQGGPAYVASKGAVIALTRSLARALGPKGVRVNAISPGIIETPMIAGYTESQRAAMKQRFPLGRFGEPDEIATAAIFLMSDGASFMTGETMHVNGGSNFG